MNEQSDTPRTDEWETYCDECYYHMWRVRRKNERGFNDGFHLNDGEGARQLVDLLNKQDSELTAARAEIDMMSIRYAAAEMHHSNNMQEVTEQRDRLAKALNTVVEVARRNLHSPHPTIERIYSEAIQSLTTND